MWDDDIVISVEGLWKRYGVENPEIIDRIERKYSLFKGRTHCEKIWALQDVSFKVRKGETFGIIGRNGSGKSTLLKVLGGVTPPTRGRVELKGSVFPMIELNAGMHLDFTGRENVRLLGTIMGLSSSKIESLMEDIESFCELGEWFDRPVRQYSSGMIARLGFGVGVNVEADILIIDEVLSVGDFAFQRKCFDKIEKLRSKGVTSIYVSHNIKQVNRLCENVLYLKDGIMHMTGLAEDVTHEYFISAIKNSIQQKSNDENNLTIFDGTGDVIISEVQILDKNFKSTENIYTGDPIIVKFKYFSKKEKFHPEFSIGIHTTDYTNIVTMGSEREFESVSFTNEGWIMCSFEALTLAPGAYGIKIGVRLTDGRLCYRKMNAKTFFINSLDNVELFSSGLIITDVKWEYQNN